MQGIQKLWFKVILVIQTEIQTNIRQKDRSILLFNVFAVRKQYLMTNTLWLSIKIHKHKKHEELYKTVYRQWIQVSLYWRYDSSLEAQPWLHLVPLRKELSRFSWKLVISSSEWREWRGREGGPGISTALNASCLVDERSQSNTKDDYEVGTVTSQHAFLSQPKRGIIIFPFNDLVS